MEGKCELGMEYFMKLIYGGRFNYFNPFAICYDFLFAVMYILTQQPAFQGLGMT